jgi:hypothetical protein
MSGRKRIISNQSLEVVESEIKMSESKNNDFTEALYSIICDYNNDFCYTDKEDWENIKQLIFKEINKNSNDFSEAVIGIVINYDSDFFCYCEEEEPENMKKEIISLFEKIKN